MESSSSTSVSQVHYACVDAFTSLLDAAVALPPDQRAWSVVAIQNAFDKYKLWAGNLGAMHSGRQWKKSLDYRLREATFYKTQVLRLLESLGNALQRGMATIDTKSFDNTDSDDLSEALPSDEDSPWEVSSDSEDDQVIQREDRNTTPPTTRINDSAGMPIASALHPSASLDLVNHIISCLWKLPIRRPAPLDRMKDTSTADTSYYQPFDIQHVMNKFPKTDERVASRLGKMISRRRQVLRYRESHTNSLSKPRSAGRRQIFEANLDEDVMDAEHIESESSYVASTHHTHSTHATTLKIDESQLPPAMWNLDAPSVTMTVSSAGSNQDNDSPLAIPKRPKGDDGAILEQFICPYCHTLQTIRTEHSWRKHVLRDLQPYVCTYAECSLGDYAFQNEEEWYKHEAQYHRYHWFCNIEGHNTFETSESFIGHMESSHQNAFQKDALHALQHTFRRPPSTQVGVCSLCFESTQKIKSHVARHLKQLALFAIPQTDFMALSDTDEEEGSDKANRSNQALYSSQGSSQDAAQTAANQFYPSSEEDTDPLVFDSADNFSLPEATEQDTSWDYVTPKFRDARVEDQADHPVQDIDPNQESITQVLDSEAADEQQPGSREFENTPEFKVPNRSKGEVLEDGDGSVKSMDVEVDADMVAQVRKGDVEGILQLQSKSTTQRGGEEQLPVETVEKKESHRDTTDAEDNKDTHVVNPHHQQRPICGASIGAYREAHHLPPVSLGGIILVDYEPYGLTVHHMLEAPSDDEDEAQDEEHDSRNVPTAGPSSQLADPQAHRGTETSSLTSNSPQQVEHPISNQVAEASSNTEGSQSLKSTVPSDETRPEAVTPWDLELSGSDESETDQADDFVSDHEFDEDGDQDSSDPEDVYLPGDVPGIFPGEGDDIIVTQPALDDVDDDFFPNSDDVVEDHLESHTFGYIFASSGIRRVKQGGVLHEVDWALIKINQERLQMYNVVEGGRRFALESDPWDPPPLAEPITRRHYPKEEDEYPMEVAPADSLSGMKVHSFGRTTGLQGGIISESMAPVRVYGRQDFSKSWYVKGGFGVGGDAGAWVFENGTGRVCGVVLAWGQKSRIAYIMPMEIILKDIKRTLGANTVCLPTRKTMAAAMNTRTTSAYETSGGSLRSPAVPSRNKHESYVYSYSYDQSNI